MTRIQTFTFDEDKGIFAAWSLLKDHRRKLVAANPNLRQTYPDEALFLILTRSLPKSFKLLSRASIAQLNLTIQEKMDMLIEHKMDLREEEVAEMAHFSKANACHGARAPGLNPALSRIRSTIAQSRITSLKKQGPACGARELLVSS
ncbi:hypothetical protein K3495_g8003 [Podosphaera aphanis]|nr:hypothetical protein K3495_g8003 [Podosphaera aphanis]